MPDIDPAALSRSDSISQPTLAPLTTTKLNGTSAPSSQKSTKPTNSAQRIELEPLYTALKAVIGDQWGTYKEAISSLASGQLNQNELSERIDHCISADPSTVHLHNQFICALIGNAIRDLPEQGVAPWVSANDKPMVLSKPVSGNAAEQRLKTEVMQLPARDRRRLKEIPDVSVTVAWILLKQDDETLPRVRGNHAQMLTKRLTQVEIIDPVALAVANEMHDYHLAKQIKLPDTVPASAGGLNKTNWDLEIRKRYSQPLASETGEFPDTDAIHCRMVPICYEEALPNGCADACAEFMATATEQFIKEVVAGILVRTRSNTIATNSIVTRKYRRQLEREEAGWLRGEVLRGVGSGLLPVEAREQGGRRALGMGDLRVALRVGAAELGQMPGVVKSVMGAWEEGILEGWGRAHPEEEAVHEQEGPRTNGNAITNGVAHNADVEDVDMEDEDWGWEGGGKRDRETLNSLLDDCLAVGQ